MNKRKLAAFGGAACPCCADRLAFTGSATFKPPESTDLCEMCVAVDDANHDVPPFQWPTSAAEIEAATKTTLADAEANLAAVSVADPPTFSTVIHPLMCAPNYKTNRLVCQAKFLQHASPDAAVREAAEEAGKSFAAFKAASRRNEAVFAKVQAFAATAECKALGVHDAHFVEALLSDFKRGGLALDAAGRAELQRLLDADAKACSKFGSNLASDATKLHFAPAELEGLPSEFIAERTSADGNVCLTLKYPDLIPVMGNCEVEATRKALQNARDSAYANNLELVAEGVGYRKATAALLGYKSWAHFVIESRMAGTPETVLAFLAKVKTLADEGAKADLEALRLAKQSHLEGRGELAVGGRAEVQSWDGSFYTNLILKRDHGVDHEAVRAYFPLDHVVATTMEIYQELLGLSFKELPSGSFSRWHEEVRCFVVSEAHADAAGATPRVGHFYLDLHPREGKYGHAAIFHLLKRKGEQTPVDCMMCNLPAPSTDGTPALLRHSDVVTFFHEFGHIMHGLCSEGEGNSTRLAKCPRDFVEAPSQMLENWCWQPAVLARLSRHHQSGQPLPDTLREALIGAKNVLSSIGILRQIYLSTLDLQLHAQEPPTSAAGLQALVDTLRPEITGIQNPPGSNSLRSFGHLMNQYSAAYYGYMWAEVISADMFATRFEADCMSVDAGMAYRKQVLAPGGTGKIMDHLSKFLGGRTPEQEPFLRSRGIL